MVFDQEFVDQKSKIEFVYFQNFTFLHFQVQVKRSSIFRQQRAPEDNIATRMVFIHFLHLGNVVKLIKEYSTTVHTQYLISTHDLKRVPSTLLYYCGEHED